MWKALRVPANPPKPISQVMKGLSDSSYSQHVVVFCNNCMMIPKKLERITMKYYVFLIER